MENCRTMYDYFTASMHTSLPRLDYYGRKFCGNEVVGRIDACAEFLHEIGVKKNDVVSICLPNIPEAVFAIYAANKIGAVADVIHPMLPPAAIKKELNKVKSVCLFCLGEVADCFSDVNIKVVVCDETHFLPPLKRLVVKTKTSHKTRFTQNADYKTYPYSEKDAYAKTQSVCGDFALYLHSGGTTGEPKIIVLTNAAVNKNADMTLCLAGVKLDFGNLIALPLFHGFGLCASLHALVSGGCCGYLMPRFNAARAAALIKKGDVCSVLGVPLIFERLVEQKAFVKGCRGMKLAFCGGDVLAVPLKQRFDSVAEACGSPCRLYQGYGLAETVSVCVANKNGADKAGSLGKPVADTRVKIVGEDGAELPPGQKGEIAVKCGSMMTHYLGESGDVSREWLLTGDVGYLDDDGFVTFVARKKRIAVIAGMNVYPAEIEDAALALPCVEQCAAVNYCEGSRQNIALFVKCADNQEEIEVRDRLCAHLKKCLIKYAVPRQIRFVNEMPRTAVGKVDYLALKKEIEGLKADETSLLCSDK